MPLRALIAGKEVISINVTDEEWAGLKRDVKNKSLKIQLPCCMQVGFLRTSSRGLRHFVHSKEGTPCDWESETPQHLKSKVEIARACKDNGWTATPEYAENDWRADILATKGDARIAFEVQWSAQTEEDTNFRQERYRQSNVRGCWFFKTPPKNLRDEFDGNPKAIKDLPIFKISEAETKNIEVVGRDGGQSLYSFVDALLKGKIKHCSHYTATQEQILEIAFFKTTCWKCATSQHLYFTNIISKSYCNKKMDVFGNDLDPRTIEIVQDILKSSEGNHLKLGLIKARYSKTVGHSYLSFGCCSCDALFGEYFLNSMKLEARYLKDNIIFRRPTTLQITEEDPHWCHSATGVFCSQDM